MPVPLAAVSLKNRLPAMFMGEAAPPCDGPADAGGRSRRSCPANVDAVIEAVPEPAIEQGAPSPARARAGRRWRCYSVNVEFETVRLPAFELL